MKQTVYTILFLWGTLSILSAQTIGEWKTHLAYYETTEVAEATQQVFAISNGSLYSYGKEDNQIRFYSKQTGLSDTEISHIRYNSAEKCLLIVYANENIDLLKEDGIKNIPDLMNTTNIQDKEVNSIYFKGERAYLSTNFGVVVLNLAKGEVIETYRLNKAVRSVCIKDNYIYIATVSGLYRAKTDSNLIDPNNWSYYSLSSPSLSDNDVYQISLYKGSLCFYIKGRGIFYQNAQGGLVNIVSDSNIQQMVVEGDQLLAYTSSLLYVFTSLTNYEAVNAESINGVSSLSGGKYWVAGGNKGLKGYQRKGDNQYEVILSGTEVNSPKRNLANYMTIVDGKLYVTGGGRWIDRSNITGTLMTYQDGSWYNFDEKLVNKQTGVECNDYLYIAVDPTDTSHFFVSSFGEGLLEFKGNTFVRQYGYKDGLEYYTGGDPLHTVRVEGLAFDKGGNLWMTNSNSKYSGIKILKADGSWVYPGYLTNYGMTDKILITSTGHVWINAFRGDGVQSAGLFVLDTNGTIDDASDDKKNFITTFNSTDGAIAASEFYCVVEDKNGTIWIGSNKGPLYCSSPRRAPNPEQSLNFSRIKRTGEDGLTYAFLDGESIYAIAVDGGNRKWIGTSNSGIFLINEDGSETIKNFTIENSPLPSNKIQSITINDQTGEVFIGTDKGIISYIAEGTQGSNSYSDVFAYPNPVRPEFDDQVTITGLMTDSNVKITDVNGNLIYQTKSIGGQATWNCRNAKGTRVATGVYLVLASTSEGKEGVVCKILVVK